MKKISIRVFVMIGFLLILSIYSKGQNVNDSIPLDSQVKQGVLQNGLKYYVLNNGQSGERISLNLLVKAGFHDEDEDQYGLAHLVEHLAFRSTKNFPQGTRNFLVRKGIRQGRDLSGSTSDRSTSYRIDIPYGNSKLLDSAMIVLKDWAEGILFLTNEIDEERSAVVRELSNAVEPVFQAMAKTKYLQLNENQFYKDNNERDIHNVKIASEESLRRFYNDWYHAKNEIVYVVGNINEEEIETLIKKYFNNLRIGVRTRNSDLDKKYNVDLSGKNKLIVNHGMKYSDIDIRIFKKQKSQTGDGYPATKGEYRTLIMQNLGSLLMNERIKSIDDGNKIGSIGIQDRVIDPLARIDAIVAYGNAQTVLQVKFFIQFVAKELKRIALYGFSTSEFDHSKAVLLNQLKVESGGLFRSTPNELIASHVINGKAFTSDEESIQREMLSSISLEEVNTMLSKWIVADGNIDIVISDSAKDPSNMPTEHTVFSWFNESFKSYIPPYILPKSKKVKELPVNFLNPRNRGYNRLELPHINATKLILENGLTVVIKNLRDSKPTTGHVRIRGIRTPNNLSENSLFDDKKRQILFEKLKSFVGVKSLKQKDVVAWEKERNKQGSILFVNPILKKDRSEIVGIASSDNIIPMFRLVHGYFAESVIDLEAFNNYSKQISFTKINATRDILEDTILSLINGRHIHFNDNSREPGLKIQERSHITASQIRKVYNKHFSNAAEFTFVITGSFDVEEIIKHVVMYLGSLDGREVRSIKEVNSRNAKLGGSGNLYPRDVALIGDSIGNVKVRVLFPGSCDLSIKNRLIVEIIVKAFRTVLFRRLREKEGGVYTVQVDRKFTKNPNEFFLDVAFETSPADVDRLVLAAQDELHQLSKGIIDDTIYANAKKLVRDRIEKELHSSLYWDNYLADQVYNETLSLEGDDRLDILDILTVVDITNAIHDFVNIDKYILFKLL